MKKFPKKRPIGLTHKYFLPKKRNILYQPKPPPKCLKNNRSFTHKYFLPKCYMKKNSTQNNISVKIPQKMTINFLREFCIERKNGGIWSDIWKLKKSMEFWQNIWFFNLIFDVSDCHLWAPRIVITRQINNNW